MGDTREASSQEIAEPLPAGRRWLARFAVLTAASTLFLIFAGGMVTSTGSGLAVPDWPKSYGMWMPPMVGGIFYEHGHRMVAAAVGFLTLIQALWIWRVDPRPGVRKWGFVALGAVITQGLLGGLTVRYLLPTPVSVSHACLAQAFFCLTVVLANWLAPGWPPGGAGRPRTACLVVAAAIYLQLILGALMRHTGAGLAIPDFPLAFGGLIPPFDRPGVPAHFAHRVWGVVVFGLVTWYGTRLARDPTLSTWARRLAGLGVALVAVQVGLGAGVIWTEKQPHLTSVHVANGALLLGLYVWVACLSAAADRRRPAPGTN